jgi:hypothetical protein
MSQRRTDRRPVPFSREDAELNKWLNDEGDYVTLERVRRPIELEVGVRLDVHKPERA